MQYFHLAQGGMSRRRVFSHVKLFDDSTIVVPSLGPSWAPNQPCRPGYSMGPRPGCIPLDSHCSVRQDWHFQVLNGLLAILPGDPARLEPSIDELVTNLVDCDDVLRPRRTVHFLT